MMPPMQAIVDVSKSLVIAVFIFTLLILDGTYTRLPDIGLTGTEASLVRLATQTTPAAEESIWPSIRQEFTLDHQAQSKQVKNEIRKLLQDQTKLHDILVSGGPYLYFILKQTQARHLPGELALIPVIESEFNPNDRSNRGATGLWQLMSGTARELGIKVREGYDGRRNVIASTQAALAYFNDLGMMFKGNWYLAIAAYDCGQGRILSAARRAGSHNFWQLSLPQETKLYVPKLLAVAAIIENPKKYGVELPPIKNAPFFEEKKLDKPVSLQQVAHQAGISLRTLNALNPDYNHGIAHKKGNYTLLLPVKVRPVKAVKWNPDIVLANRKLKHLVRNA